MLGSLESLASFKINLRDFVLFDVFKVLELQDVMVDSEELQFEFRLLHLFDFVDDFLLTLDVVFVSRVNLWNDFIKKDSTVLIPAVSLISTINLDLLAIINSISLAVCEIIYSDQNFLRRPK